MHISHNTPCLCPPPLPPHFAQSLSSVSLGTTVILRRNERQRLSNFVFLWGGGRGNKVHYGRHTYIHTCFIYLESYTIKGISISIWEMHKWIIASHLASLWNRTLRQHRWWPKYRVKRDSAVHCLQNLGRLYSQRPCLLCSSEKKQATNKQKVKEWYFWKRRFPPSPRLSLPFTRKRCFGYQKHRYVHRNGLQNENGRWCHTSYSACPAWYAIVFPLF